MRSLIALAIAILVITAVVQLPILSAKPGLSHSSGYNKPTVITVATSNKGQIIVITLSNGKPDPIILNCNDDSDNDTYIDGSPF